MQSESGPVRWLVLAAFTPKPTGAAFSATAEGVKSAMEAAQIVVPLSKTQSSANISIPSLRSCTLAGIAASALTGLQTILDELSAGDCGLELLPDRIGEIVGQEAELTKAVSALVTSAAASAAATPAKGAGKSGAPKDVVDAIFAKVDSGSTVAPATPAQSAVSAFIGANKKPKGRTGAAPRNLVKKIKYAVEDAIMTRAAAILASSEVVGIESTWRGLNFLVNQCPTSAGMQVDCVDTTSDKVCKVIRELLDDEQSELPDAIFIAEPTTDIDKIRELAELGEELQVPIVVATEASLFSATNLDEVIAGLDTPYGGLPASWQELVAEEATRWLSLVINQIVVFSEGAGSARRVVLASPVFGVAAMLAASYKDTGDYSRLYGKAGSLAAPASWSLKSGRFSGVAVPTEAFFSAATQSKLANLGVLGMGSARNSELLALNAAPTLRSSQSALPLPSQILAGKVVRFALWARQQVPADASDEEVSALFQEAAHVFLFRGATEGITFQAEAEGQGDERKINIGVDIARTQGQNRFQLAFTLPLR